MNKIQQLLEVDLSNANTCLELLMAILIKEFLDHKQKYNWKVALQLYSLAEGLAILLCLVILWK